MQRWEKDDVLKVVKGILRLVNKQRLHRYWDGFSQFPFAFYDQETVYLVKHSSPPQDFQPLVEMNQVYVGKWRAAFMGNTSIYFAEEVLAIVNLEYIEPTIPFAKVAALMIHEMFHAFQQKEGYWIEYSEWTFVKYPLIQENLTWRVQEREELLKAVFAKNEEARQDHLFRFVVWREKRKKLLGSLINYEFGIESNEGTATYVEYKVRVELSDLPQEFILAQYGQPLVGYPESLKEFRHSCYPAGMFICLLLDQIQPSWQTEYLAFEGSLYEFLIGKFDVQPIEVEIADLRSAKDLMLREEEKKQCQLQQFQQSEGYKVVLSGYLQVRFFNPMNITVLGNQILHGTFLGLVFGDDELLIQGQSLSRHDLDELDWVSQVIFYVQKQPIIENGLVKLVGVGQMQGEMKREEDRYCIFV